MSVKQAYFQGGGGVNEPTPKKKKYKSDPALVVQPRFKEPFYRNYDLYNTPGEHSPGAGWHDMEKYKSVQEFLKAKRKKLKDKYKADDSWQQDNGERTKENPNIKARAAIFERIIKTARMPGMGLFHSLQRKFGPLDKDNNDIDFPIDDQVDTSLIGPLEDEINSNPVGQANLTGGKLDEYLPEEDFEGKLPTELDFGRDYTDTDGILNKLINKYLSSSDTGLFGLPDGVDSEGHDAERTMEVEQPYTGTSDIGTNIYEDKWNI